MSHRRAQLWVLWLLPFLAVRALMPVGFMAHMDHGQFKLVLCSGGFAKVVDNSADEVIHAHGNSVSHTDICPFAFSSGAALSRIAVQDVVDFLYAERVTSVITQPRVTATFSRANRVRGPPIFS